MYLSKNAINNPFNVLLFPCCFSVTHSCLTLWDSIDCSPPGSSICGIFPARILEWAAISSSRGSPPPRDQTCISFFSCIASRFLTSQSLGKPRFSVVIYFIHGGLGLVTKSCPTLVTPWTAACQDPLFMGFSSQEYWSGLPFPSPGDLPDPGIKPRSPALQADSLPNEL